MKEKFLEFFDKIGNKKIIVIILVCFFIMGVMFFRSSKLFKKSLIEGDDNVGSANVIVVDSKDIDDKEDEGKIDYFVSGDFLDDGIVTDDEKMAMESNTKYLQELVDNAKRGEVIKLPKGIFYFSSGGENVRKYENYVIKLNSNVHIVGAGIDESSGDYTILKPYAEEGTIKHGLDMFYFNEYADSYGKNPVFLENLSFSDFIIDGEDVRGNEYNSSGKGFLIKLCRDCHWDNMMVRNTDATGFGMDNLIDSTITNSIAINCGKNADVDSEGASGFGIGTGYSDEESVYIENCIAIGNKKFGFFFENQGRFSNLYDASSANGFVVVNSSAYGNLYNFGGLRANDVLYVNCKSDKSIASNYGINNDYTKLDIYFSDDSRRVAVIDFNTDDYFLDVIDKSSYYYEAVNWALRNGYSYGNSSDTFGVGMEISRAYALGMLWRYDGRSGDVLRTGELASNRKITNIKTGFDDVSPSSWYAGAIKWAYKNNIVKGVSNSKFNPDDYVTRADFITMLWRYAGSPIVSGNDVFGDVSSNSYYYEAVKWAYSMGIVKGVSGSEFRPLDYCLREQVVTFLYRYDKVLGNNYSIKYLLMGGSVSGNPDSYKSNSDTIVLNNPSKKGYTFVGWIGSNGDKPSLEVKISKGDTGNKFYVALFSKDS